MHLAVVLQIREIQAPQWPSWWESLLFWVPVPPGFLSMPQDHSMFCRSALGGVAGPHSHALSGGVRSRNFSWVPRLLPCSPIPFPGVSVDPSPAASRDSRGCQQRTAEAGWAAHRTDTLLLELAPFSSSVTLSTVFLQLIRG